MLRRLFVIFALLCLGCSAQSNPPDLNRKIERQVRSTFKIPAQVQLTIGPRKASSDFTGFESVTVTFTAGEHTQTHDFLLSKDGKTLVSVTKMNLDEDPYGDVMKKIDVSGRPWRGAKDAKVVAVVYDDFQCPFCSRMHATIFNDVMKNYGDRVKVVYKDYPLFEIHPWAGRAAINSNCLAQQSIGAYWDFADYVHYNGKAISGEKRPIDGQFAELDRMTMEFGKKHSVDTAKLQQCVKDQPDKALQASVKEAESLGVNATPALFVNGFKVDGAVPPQELRAIIDQALRDAGEQVPATSASAPASGK